MKFKSLLVTLAVLVATVLFATVVWAGYTHMATLNAYFASAEKEFYFTSDLLKSDSIPEYHITHDWKTDATIRVELRNYENPLKVSNQTIHYQVVTDPQTDPVQGTITANAPQVNKQTINLRFKKPNSQSPLEVIVTASATSPYSKILRGKFIISPEMTFEVNNNAGSLIAVLTISFMQSERADAVVNIQWPEGAAPDMTNPIVMAAMDKGNVDLTNRKITATLNTASVYKLIFFKDVPLNHYGGITVTQ